MLTFSPQSQGTNPNKMTPSSHNNNAVIRRNANNQA